MELAPHTKGFVWGPSLPLSVPELIEIMVGKYWLDK
jgi:hypothetical protein